MIPPTRLCLTYTENSKDTPKIFQVDKSSKVKRNKILVAFPHTNEEPEKNPVCNSVQSI